MKHITLQDTKFFQVSCKKRSKFTQQEIKNHGLSHIIKETTPGMRSNMINPMRKTGIMRLTIHQVIKSYQVQLKNKFIQLVIKNHGQSHTTKEIMLGMKNSMINLMRKNGIMRQIIHLDTKFFLDLCNRPIQLRQNLRLSHIM